MDVELNVSDIQIVDQLRILLQHGPELLSLGPIVNVTHINITTGENGASSDTPIEADFCVICVW